MRSCSRGAWGLIGVLVLTVGTSAIRAEDKISEKLATTLGKDVVMAAHPSAQDPALLSYKEAMRDERLIVSIRMKYYGKTTSLKYTSNITITIDPSKEPPRVVDVEYKDDNKVPSNKKNLKNIGDQIAGRLPRKL